MSEIFFNNDNNDRAEEFANAIQYGDANTVQSLIDKSLVDPNIRLSHRQECPPALVYAVRCGQLAIVKILLQASADIDCCDNMGNTACHAAIGFGNCVDGVHDILELLLSYRPNLSRKNSDQQTALQMTLGFFPTVDRCISALIDAGAPFEEIPVYKLRELAGSSTNLIRSLLNRGFSVRDFCVHGLTPLHYAASHILDVSILDMLVNICGIDINAKDQYGNSCIRAAVASDNLVALDWFIQAGADIDCITNNGFTLLHVVQDYDCAISLIAAGADFSNTPIRVIPRNATESLVSALLLCSDDTIRPEFLDQVALARHVAQLLKSVLILYAIARCRCALLCSRSNYLRFNCAKFCCLHAVLSLLLFRFTSGGKLQLLSNISVNNDNDD